MKNLRKISKEEFGEIQLDSAMILNKFDSKGLQAVQPQDEICLTTGDVSITVTPLIQNVLDDVNNVPQGLMEGVDLMGWTVTAAFTAVTSTPAAIKLAVGAATVAGDKVTGNAAVADKDFSDIWIVGKKTGGGFAVAHLLHAIGTGTTMTYGKNAKGQWSVSLTAHPSIADDDPYAAPVEFYSTAPKQ